MKRTDPTFSDRVRFRGLPTRSANRLTARWRRRSDGRSPITSSAPPLDEGVEPEVPRFRRLRNRPWIRTSHSDSQQRRFRR
jgi:hypothetical protein